MTRTRVFVLVLVALLLAGLPRPRRVHALSTEQAVIISIAGVAAYAGLIYVGYQMVYGDGAHFLVPPARRFDLPEQRAQSRLHVGPECHTPDGQPVLLCW
ncbi:MAG: hypothetical protein HYR72_12920 [Deltaproteobacteria bacterium]|nr:hypothetical protein [Deltaproteobacteria bacterium]MBI3390459.1 hypothetical protein [Deltaproteobacteria bacterium]